MRHERTDDLGARDIGRRSRRSHHRASHWRLGAGLVGGLRPLGVAIAPRPWAPGNSRGVGPETVPQGGASAGAAEPGAPVEQIAPVMWSVRSSSACSSKREAKAARRPIVDKVGTAPNERGGPRPTSALALVALPHLAGDWVAAGVDDDLPGVAPLPDEALCHAREGTALTVVDKSLGTKRSAPQVCWWWGRPGRTRTCNLRIRSKTPPVRLVMTWGLAAGRVRSVVRPVTSRSTKF
jgi:hypothetical protein